MRYTPPSAVTRHLHVVDNFYKDPDAVRDLALKTDYQEPHPAQKFAGRESVRPFYSDKLREKFRDIVGEDITVDPQSLIFGKFRVAQLDSPRPTKVHCDLGADWTAVVHLTPHPPKESGLTIFRHIPSGLDEMPESDEQAQSLGFRDRSQIDSDIVLRDSLDETKWELIAEIPAEYNRCVIFRGALLFHAASSNYGQSPSEARLTQHFFFRRAAKSRQRRG